MTSINAIRFNRYEGACLCDESISSTDDMRIDVSDKIQPCLPSVIVEKYGTVAAIGTTGTCSIGDEIKTTFEQKVLKLYQQEIEKCGAVPEKFLKISEMAPFVFDIIVSMKCRIMSNKFIGEYGFNLDEFIAGSYEKDNKKFEIKDADTIRQLSTLLNWKYQQEEVGFIFRNAVLFVGYDDDEGVSILHYDLRGGYWHTVHTCYFAEGSGRHSVDPGIYSYVENLLVKSRRGDINRVEGVMALIHALTLAMDHEIGVGGYPNIIIIDGHQKDPKSRMREISDERSYLACQIARALDKNYISYADAYAMCDELLYWKGDFNDIYNKFFSKARNVRGLTRLLRGYKILPYHEDIVS